MIWWYAIIPICLLLTWPGLCVVCNIFFWQIYYIIDVILCYTVPGHLLLLLFCINWCLVCWYNFFIPSPYSFIPPVVGKTKLIQYLTYMLYSVLWYWGFLLAKWKNVAVSQERKKSSWIFLPVDIKNINTCVILKWLPNGQYKKSAWFLHLNIGAKCYFLFSASIVELCRFSETCVL